MTKVYIALGSNLGDRGAALDAATSRLPDRELSVTRCATRYRTAPVGPPGQAEYYNTVVEVETTKTPEALLDHVKNLERALGRTETVRWGPRVIDLDILLYGTTIHQSARLVLPHPELQHRAFVLVPLAELAPGLVVPGLGRTVLELRDALSVAPGDLAPLGPQA